MTAYRLALRRRSKLTILGATGSIGRSTEAVILGAPGPFETVAVAGGRDAKNLARVADRWARNSPRSPNPPPMPN